ncbi:protein vein isoform X2 [Drosophila hydei]|uniref:Protein vein isoform X2 n=1 Tax=Drosophila hydei TaxID=7224 RepID=A0A6J2SZ56_DROHY|nr:protein vein isoform X2 [Drosophila hydei]
MYAQHVRKWSLKTQPKLMSLISIAIFVSYMLLLITCAPTITTAAAAAATAIENQHQQQQRSWESEESSYYIALPPQQQQQERQEQQQQQQLADNGSGSSESVGSNIDNNILSRLLSRPSNSLSSTSNIKLRPATVFDVGSDSDAAVQQQQQQHIAAVTTQQQQSQQQVPNMLINSQRYKLLNNGMSPSSKTRRYALQQQQQQLQQQHQHQQQLQLSSYARQLQLQQQNVTAYNYSSRVTAAAQRYLIESYEVPESSQELAARNRRDFGSDNGQRKYRGHRQQQQEAKREYRLQRQHQRQQQRQQQRHQQRRKHPRKHRNKLGAGRYCSAREPDQLAYAAPTVIMGVFISRTANRPANFSATMKVLQVYKKQRDLQLPQLVRFQFAQRNGSGVCDIYRERPQVRGLIHFNLEQSSDIPYMMFVQQTNPGNFSILGQPIRATDKVRESVQAAVNENYAQNASIILLKAEPNNATIENNAELRITCMVQGRPPPKVTWFKDDKSIKRRPHVYQIKHHKRRSQLIVRHFNSSTDAGKYECRAKNKVSNTIDKRRIMISAHPVYSRSDNPNSGKPCVKNHCFHGGTCRLLLELNQIYCNCPDGFTGERCEFSRPDSTYSNYPMCGVKYYGGYYC